MNIEVLTFFGASPPLVDAVEGAGFALAGFAATGVSLATDGRTPFTAEELPTAKGALEEASASALAFSNIAFCFSSSLARIGMRSSGMGLLSYRDVRIMGQCNRKGRRP
jgi:hypothetical protein